MIDSAASPERIASTRLDAAALKILADPSATISDLRKTLGEERFGALISLAAIAARLESAGCQHMSEGEKGAQLFNLVAQARTVNPEFFDSPLVRQHASNLHLRATQEVEADAGVNTLADSTALQRRGFGAVAAAPIIRFGAEDQPELYVDFRLLDDDLDVAFEMELALHELLIISYATLIATTEALDKMTRLLGTGKSGWQAPNKELRDKLTQVRAELDRLDVKLSSSNG